MVFKSCLRQYALLAVMAQLCLFGPALAQDDVIELDLLGDSELIAASDNDDPIDTETVDIYMLIDSAKEQETLGDFAQAEALYRKTYLMSSTSEEKMWAEIGIARSLVMQGKYAEAEPILKDLIARNVDSADPRYLLARAYAWQKYDEEAVKYYQENLALYPKHDPSKLGLVEVYSWQGRYRKANALYQELVASGNSDPEMYSVGGRLQTFQGKLLTAKEIAEEGKEKYPFDRDILASYFEATRLLGRPDMSVFDYIPAESPGKARKDNYAEEHETIHELLRPYFMTMYVPHTEAGTVDEKLKFTKFSNQAGYFPTPNSHAYVTFEPTFYESGGDLERENRLTYGVGGAYQWTDKVALKGWVGVADFSNDERWPVYGRLHTNYRSSDQWHTSLLFDRYPVEESVLSASGLIPQVGVFANMLVGRVTRNEWTWVNRFLLPRNLELQLIGAGGFDTGYQMDNNNFYKLEYTFGKDLRTFVSPRWTHTWFSRLEGRYWHFEDDRLGNGGAFLSVRQFGLPLGSDNVSPTPAPGNPGTGGYFSPDHYVLQVLRLGNRGEIGDDRFFYDVSAIAGIQDASRFGSEFTYGVQLMGELVMTKWMQLLFGGFYNNAQEFDQGTAFIGFRFRF